ncbi:glycosyltransferase [Patescibacteria group bacterium]
MAKVSINLVTYNGEKYISPCLSSVLKQTFKDFQLIIIENGSSDGTKVEIEKWKEVFTDAGIGVKVIYNEENAGFAEGHNQGFKCPAKSAGRQISSADSADQKNPIRQLADQMSRQYGGQANGQKEQFGSTALRDYGATYTKYILCLNQDIVMEPDYLERIVKFMDAHKEVGSVNGKLMRMTSVEFPTTIENKNLSISAPLYEGGQGDDKSERIPLSPFNKGGTNIDYFVLKQECKIIDSVGLKIFKSNRVIEIGQGEQDNGQYDEVKEVFGVSGALPLYRKDALEDVRISQNVCRGSRSSRFGQSEADVKHGMTQTPPTSPRQYGGQAYPPPIRRAGILGQEGGVNFNPSSGRRGVDQYEYFDTDFVSYKEDVDLAYRMRWRGWKSYVIPQAIAYHERGAKQVAGGKNDLTVAVNRKNKSKYANYYSQRNQILMLIKNLPELNFATFWYEFKKFGYEMIFEWSTFKAWIDVFKKIKVMKVKRQWIMENRKVEWKEISKWMG